MQSTTPHPTKAKTQAGGVGAPWNLYVTLIILNSPEVLHAYIAPVGIHAPTGITAYLANGGALEHSQEIVAHESPRTTKLYDRTGDEITLDEVERITI